MRRIQNRTGKIATRILLSFNCTIRVIIQRDVLMSYLAKHCSRIVLQDFGSFLSSINAERYAHGQIAHDKLYVWHSIGLE